MHFPILLAALLLLALPCRAEPLDSIAAIVNNEAITCYDVQQDSDAMLQQLRMSGSTYAPSAGALNQRSLDARIVKILQLQQARKLQLKVGEEELNSTIEKLAARNGLVASQMKDALKQQGIDYEDFKKNLVDQLLISKVINVSVRSKLQISEEAIREYYRKYVANPKARREVQLGEIFLSLPAEPTPAKLASMREKAKKIHQQLLAGREFSQLVAIYSESPDRQQQGVMGWFSKGTISQRFDPALELPVNGISDPIRSPSGIHILKAMDERWQEPEIVGESYDEAHARHILLQIPESADDEAISKILQRAEDIADEMSDASDEAFATRAREASQGPSASRGGDLGWFRKGAMLPEFEKVVFAMNAGETSSVVKTKFGLHIIRLIAKRHINPNSLEANREKITEVLTSVEMQEKLPRWIASIRAEASLKFNTCPQAVTRKTAALIDAGAASPLDQEIRGALEAWRAAWSQRDVKTYLAAYSDQFNPGKQYAGLAAWKAYRTRALTNKSYIRVRLSNIKINQLAPGSARVEFEQDYEADNLVNHDLKLLLMQKSDAGWKIIREMAAVSSS